MAFDVNGKFAGGAEAGGGGQDEDGAIGDAEQRVGRLVKDELVDAGADGGARKLLTGGGVEGEDGVAHGDVEAVMVRAEDDAGGLGGVERKAGNNLQRGAEDEDAAAIEQGEEELAARGS